MAKDKKNPFSNSVSIKNKKASFEYEFIDKYVCGIALKGSEVKSIRMGRATLGESYCYLHEGEVFIKNMNIAQYENGSYANHEPTRIRKLLLNKKEINKIERKLQDVGITLVPVKLFSADRGFMKLEIAVAKGKKLHDKRNTIKDRDQQRDSTRY